MSWINQNAVKRVFNVYKRSKDKIYKEDIDALKIISEALEDSYKRNTVDNMLFAKLLSITLLNNVRFYKDTLLSIKLIGKDLKQPLDYHLQMLKMELNTLEFTNFTESLGIKDWKNEAELNERDKIVFNNQKEMIEKLNKSWGYEDVEKSFYKTANQFLTETENYI
jgi:hypothetical protein